MAALACTPFFSSQCADIVGKLSGYYTNIEDAARIGLKYLSARPEEASIATIVELICPSDSEAFAQLMGADENGAREVVAKWQRDDFRYGRIANVSGWQLSETEARLCALAALTI
jgi:hypothetical protein